MNNWITLHDSGVEYYVNVNNIRYIAQAYFDNVPCSRIAMVGGEIVVDEDIETIKRMIQNNAQFNYLNK